MTKNKLTRDIKATIEYIAAFKDCCDKQFAMGYKTASYLGDRYFKFQYKYKCMELDKELSDLVAQRASM